MSLDLHVDGERWRSHLRAVVAEQPGLVPVAKGNGYGVGLASLARRTQWLGCEAIAVGTYREVAAVASRFDGDVVVMEPWRPFLDVAYGPRIVHTVGRVADLAALSGRDDRPRVLLEGLTSMRRHGFALPDLVDAARPVRGVRLEGAALHLPLGSGHLDEVERWLAGVELPTWFVSHLSAAELTELSTRYPQRRLRPRIGTRLWLGDRVAFSARAEVLDAHPVSRGDRLGYRQRRVRTDGTVLVVSGGTAHGIGLESPAAGASVGQRARSLARGGLDAAGLALSPYIVAGKQRWFVEPPHMQVSMIWLPGSVAVPSIGDEVEAEVRYTTTTFDRVLLS